MHPRSLLQQQRAASFHAGRLQARRAALRRRLACRAAGKQPEGSLAGDSLKAARSLAKDQDGAYPEYETEPDTELLPKRKPGNFPSVRPQTTVQKALSGTPPLALGCCALARRKLSAGMAAAVVGLDGGDKPPVAEGVAWDPLRDGPLRYCGYANECG